MKNDMRKIMITALGAAALAGGSGYAAAQDTTAAPAGVTGDMTIELSQVPPAVLMVADRHMPGFKVTSADVDLGEDGMMVYEVAGTDMDGKNVELDVHPDGRLDEIEREIAMGDVPEKVSKLMKAYLADFQPTKIELSQRSDMAMVYEFEGTHDGRDVDVEISAAGDMILIVDDNAA
jgi:uncharacterized membrane protein YkoI